MAKQVLNIGTNPNDGTGDQLRVAMDKVNDNFGELYGASDCSTTSAILTNNATTYINIGDKTLHESINVSYRLRRGSGRRSGSFDILSDGSALYMTADSFISNDACTGNIDSITFDKSLSGNNIRISGAVDNSVYNVTMYYDLKRKLI